MSTQNNFSTNLQLDINPAVLDEKASYDLYKLYNACKLLAEAIDRTTGASVPDLTDLSEYNLMYLLIQNMTQVYRIAAVTIPAGYMVGLNGSGQFVLGTEGAVIGFAPSAITAGSGGRVNLLGLNTALSGLSTGSMYYATSGGGITATPSTQKIGFALSSNTLFVNPN